MADVMLENSLLKFKRIAHRSKKQKYKVGDKVFTPIYRCEGGEILEVKEKTFYLVKSYSMEKEKYSDIERKKYFKRWYFESEIFPVDNESNFTREKTWKDYISVFTNKKPIGSFFDSYLEGYLFIKPDYQREIVWTAKQRKEFLDSIFSFKDTGSLSIIRDTNLDLEVLDGLQRFSTVFDYMLDKYKYRGKLFSELSTRDRNTLKSHMFKYSQLEPVKDFTTEQKVELFIDLNTKGKPVSKKHIEKLKEKHFKKEEK